MKTNYELLKMFCAGQKEIRDYLREPFSDDKYTYATNGTVLLRVPVFGDFKQNDISKTIGEKVIGQAAKDEFIKLKDLPEIVKIKCNFCDGKGKLKKCTDCSGEGELECDLGHWHDCEACDGDGMMPGDGESCTECEGEGKKHEVTYYPIGEASIDLKYAHLIAGLDGAEIATPKDPHRAVYFRFDVGDGAVMPLR